MSCVCNDNGYIDLIWLYVALTLVNIKCLISLMILSIYKEEVDNLYKKSIVHNLIKNGDVRLENVLRWGK